MGNGVGPVGLFSALDGYSQRRFFALLNVDRVNNAERDCACRFITLRIPGSDQPQVASSRIREAACLKHHSSLSKAAVEQNRRVVLWNSHILNVAHSGPPRRAVQEADRKVSEILCCYQTALCEKSKDQHRYFFAL